MPLERTAKVFTSWDPDYYMLGKPGDYLAVHKDNPKDVYVIAEDIFKMTYAPLSKVYPGILLPSYSEA
jgi:phosphoglycolate phosphatase